MATAAIFTSLRRRKSPSVEALLAPVEFDEVALLQTLVAVSKDLLSCFSGKSLLFQGKNSRSLVRKVEVFLVLLECLRDSRSGSRLPQSAVVCLQEAYLVLYRSKLLLDYCVHSSKSWLLIQSHSISGHFHDLNQEISTILDVFPFNDVEVGEDVREQIELMKKQARKSKLYIDKHDEALRVRFFSFLDAFENGTIPNLVEFRLFFVEGLGIKDAESCRAEIEFLEEQIITHGGDVEPCASVLNGFVAITRYCRFLLFGFDENGADVQFVNQKKPKKGLITQEIADTFISIPKDFCCPITLDLMLDPVMISTGQTYDRSSITRWINEGHCTCPKTGQMLDSTHLVPNHALRNLIMQWCAASGIPYEPPEHAEPSCDALAAAVPSKAAIEANRATTTLLIYQLAHGSQVAKTLAACEIRLLAKSGRENRALIAEAGAIPYLCRLLSSENPVMQENALTAMLNLSIYDKNKSRIMDEEKCLGLIVKVLRFGLTAEARENAAATLFSLSAVHEYKKRIADEEGAVEALANLLSIGTSRGKKDAVTALFNLSTHAENCARMIESGAVTSLVTALENEGVAEEAAGALALIMRQPIGAEAVGGEDFAVARLIGMMRCGSPKGKENAVAALLEMCRSGGAVAAQKVLKAPAVVSLLQMLLFTGTKRARRKAASLARVFQRCGNLELNFGGFDAGHTFAGNAMTNRGSGFVGEDSTASMPVTVPVL